MSIHIAGEGFDCFRRKPNVRIQNDVVFRTEFHRFPDSEIVSSAVTDIGVVDIPDFRRPFFQNAQGIVAGVVDNVKFIDRTTKDAIQHGSRLRKRGMVCDNRSGKHH